MGNSTVSLEIIGPERPFYPAADFHKVVIEAEGGELCVLPGHTSLLAGLRIGRCVTHRRRDRQTFAVQGGICEVLRDRMTILTRAAEETADIDVERAQRAKERAEQRLQSHEEDIDMDRARAALARAVNRLTVARNAG